MSLRDWCKILFYLAPPLLALGVLTSVHFKTELTAFIMAGNNAEEILLANEMQSGALSRRYLLSVETTSGASVPAGFTDAFEKSLQGIDGVLSVWQAGQQSGIMHAMQTLYSQYSSQLYSLRPEQTLAELFSPQGLEQRAALLKRLLLSPQGSIIKNIAMQDPLLLTLSGFRSVAGQLQQSRGEDGRYGILILETAMAGLDSTQQQRIQSAIQTVFNSLNATSQEAMQLEMTGVPVFAVATQQLIQGDIVRVSMLSSLALAGLFIWLFRSFVSLIQVFSLLIIVILMAILITQLAFGYVHGMTVAIGSTLVGIGIDYPIHALAHAQTVKSQLRYAVISKIWPSMVLGGVTTLVGYTALGASGFAGFQQVALYAGSGIIAALLLTRFILPNLLAAAPSRQLQVPLASVWSAFCQRFRGWLIVFFVLAFCVSLFGLRSLRWIEDMQELTPELNYLKENDKRIRARMVSIEPGRFILIAGTTTEAALRNTEQTYVKLEQLKQQGDLEDYFGLYPWLLSAHKQQQNRTLLQHYLTPENLALWHQALQHQGLSVERLGGFDYSVGAPLTLEQVLATPVKQLIDSRILVSGQQTLVIIWLGLHQPEAVKAAVSGMPDVRYISQRDMLNTMTRGYTEKAWVLLFAGLVLIMLSLAVYFKSLRKTLQTLAPAALSATLILGVWSFSGAAISFLHVVGFLLVVAICVDYGIFYQENRGGNIALTYQSMAASMLTSALAFGCLAVADSTSLRILAGVVALGVVLGFLLCPILIKHSQD